MGIVESILTGQRKNASRRREQSESVKDSVLAVNMADILGKRPHHDSFFTDFDGYSQSLRHYQAE
jgi:hypothetical protein